MPDFDYEQSLWGSGEASLRWSSPTSFRLEQALKALGELSAQAVVVEVGTGIGQFIRAIKKSNPQFICQGCDISSEAIERARKYNDDVEYRLNTTEKLPYADNSVDAVVIFDVLEHVEHPKEMIKEVQRVLRNGGLFYCFVPCESDWLSLWNLLDIIGLKHDLTKKYAGHINYFSRKELTNLFKEKNFKFVSHCYSEHLFGQLVNMAAFFLMHRAARKNSLAQLNNEAYFEGLKARQSRLGKVVRNIVNSLIYLESRLLKRIPSPNIHLVLKK